MVLFTRNGLRLLSPQQNPLFPCKLPCKYEDLEGTNGFLEEDSFMEVLTTINPDLNDSETFALAQKFFPKATSTINYQDFLDQAF